MPLLWRARQDGGSRDGTPASRGRGRGTRLPKAFGVSFLLALTLALSTPCQAVSSSEDQLLTRIDQSLKQSQVILSRLSARRAIPQEGEEGNTSGETTGGSGGSSGGTGQQGSGSTQAKPSAQAKLLAAIDESLERTTKTLAQLASRKPEKEQSGAGGSGGSSGGTGQQGSGSTPAKPSAQAKLLAAIDESLERTTKTLAQLAGRKPEKEQSGASGSGDSSGGTGQQGSGSTPAKPSAQAKLLAAIDESLERTTKTLAQLARRKPEEEQSGSSGSGDSSGGTGQQGSGSTPAKPSAEAKLLAAIDESLERTTKTLAKLASKKPEEEQSGSSGSGGSSGGTGQQGSASTQAKPSAEAKLLAAINQVLEQVTASLGRMGKTTSPPRKPGPGGPGAPGLGPTKPSRPGPRPPGPASPSVPGQKPTTSPSSGTSGDPQQILESIEEVLDSVDRQIEAMAYRAARPQSPASRLLPLRARTGGYPLPRGGVTPGRLNVKPQTTRWNAARERLTEFLRAYPDNDVYTFDSLLASEVRPARSLLRNGMESDHQREMEISLEVILRSYQFTSEKICTYLEWNRSGLNRETKQTNVQRGAFQVCQERESEWKMTEFRGFLPFGLADAELRKQSAAGQPNPDPGYMPPASGVTGDRATGPLTLPLNLDPTPGGFGNVAVLDLDTGTVRKAEQRDPAQVAARSGEDVLVSIDLGLPPGTVTVQALPGALVSACGGGRERQLLDFVRIQPDSLGTRSDDRTGPVFGIRTESGRYVLLRVPDGALATYWIDDDPELHPGGSFSCP